MKINLKLKIKSPFIWTSKIKPNKINTKINDIDKLYIMEDHTGLYINENILWPVKLIISAERIIELEELAVNNFYMQEEVLISICKYNENRTEIELNLTGVNPMRMFLSLKNKFIFNRINIT
jgi:hypothetical protein